MRDVRFLLMGVMAATLLLSGVAAAPPQASELPSAGACHYFDESGHYVCGEFLDFFDTWGGAEIFGFPITEAFDDPVRGLWVQYFQRTRMEWHPYNLAPYKVQLGLLVEELGYRFPLANPDHIPPSDNRLHHYFPETGHVVSYAFLDYFREKGGLTIFGYPRSEFMYEDGYIVQYFQRARMEWHPERINGQQMHLTNLGEIYVERFGVPGGYDTPLPPPSALGDSPTRPTAMPLRISASASVRYVIVGQEGTQTVFVYVTDQRRQPVQSASASMVVHYPSGDQEYTFKPTGTSGFTRHSFDIPPSPPGQTISIDVTVTYSGLTATTRASFVPWW